MMMDDWKDSYWANRTLCNVLEDMRSCFKTMNFAPMASLIEEAQVMGNKMEAGLEDKKDLFKLNKERHELKKKVLEARKELAETTGDKDD